MSNVGEVAFAITSASYDFCVYEIWDQFLYKFL